MLIFRHLNHSLDIGKRRGRIVVVAHQPVLVLVLGLELIDYEPRFRPDQRRALHGGRKWASLKSFQRKDPKNDPPPDDPGMARRLLVQPGPQLAPLTNKMGRLTTEQILGSQHVPIKPNGACRCPGTK
jgi:hypothetical protein